MSKTCHKCFSQFKRTAERDRLARLYLEIKAIQGRLEPTRIMKLTIRELKIASHFRRFLARIRGKSETSHFGLPQFPSRDHSEGVECPSDFGDVREYTSDSVVGH